MAGADFALARGFASLESNPANLFLDDSVAFSFGSSVHGGRVVVTGASLFDLADIVTSAGLGSSTLLDDIPEGGLRIDAVTEGLTANVAAEMLGVPDPSGRADVPTLGFTYKNGGLAIRQRTIMTAIVSRELVDLAVNGFNPEQINEYAAKNTSVRSFTLTSFTFGMGKHLTERVAAGFSVRYLSGRKLINVRVFEPEIDVDNELLSASAASVESRGGNGFGLDLGVTYEHRPELFFSLAIQNFAQRMWWSETLWVSQSTFDQDDIGSSDMRELIGRFNATEFDAQGTTLEAYATSKRLFKNAFLPRTVIAGVGYRASTGTEIQLTGTKAWGRGTLVPSRLDRVALGIQHPLTITRLRAGFAFEENGTRQFAGGVGFEIGSLKLDLGGGWSSGRGSMAGIVHGLSASVGLAFIFLGDGVG
jgi:hypothetical protein